MNTHDKYELPPLPDTADDNGRFGHGDMKRYARSAIEADRKHFAELFTDLNRYSNGMYEQEYDPYMEGVADGYGYAAEFLLGNRNAAEEIEADLKRRGGPVGYFQNVNSLFPDAEPLYEQVAGEHVGDPDVFPLYAAPQPAEPVKVPSDDDLLALIRDHAFRQYEFDYLLAFARDLLNKYGAKQ